MKENGSSNSTSISKYSDYYVITEEAELFKLTESIAEIQNIEDTNEIAIDSFTTNLEERAKVGALITITVEASGAEKLLYQFRIYKGTEMVHSTDYTTDNTCDWTPEEAGEYTLQVYVKDEELEEEYDVCGQISCMVEESAELVEEEAVDPVEEKTPPGTEEIIPGDSDVPPETEEIIPGDSDVPPETEEIIPGDGEVPSETDEASEGMENILSSREETPMDTEEAAEEKLEDTGVEETSATYEIPEDTTDIPIINP